ncbi:carbohydrate ABC transporter permease [Priestia aryabhattai]|uniref:carbohydrate ABC transporter permease n=1 Tax=Priestia aryabhattai TaxID=412384 RepID=UPI0008DDD896|nr:carbohydrate ABC transporter permease [Priestia aryabhattai]MBX9969556.1 carbohydrate ABC transporter permease [Priestia aryabhattai]MBZ6484063.1 carbohydrate ABC transporter permease [Priestia aryabhattai]MDH3115553.1 carbohydrate ABC transporter permease [Priestia aryabhattai]MDH3125553.1 carbohydrate ABC transporter permease [Priestia aryabhattai]MDH3134227.1 carbohydrate ABC transporter permease [Priestia aryabhattai]
MKQNPFRHLILGIYGLIILLPLSLVLLTTFKTTPELYSNPIGLPAGWNIENYKQLLVNEPIFGYIKNSVIVTVFSTFFILWFSSMIAYAIIQLPQKLGWIVYGFFVCGMIVPTQVNMIPVFLLMNKLGLVNTLTGVIIVSISFLLPIGVFIITGFMKTLPKELFEAARIDGASEWKIYSKIALRLSIPSMATVGIFSFVIVWNDLLFPLLLLKSKEVKTLPIALLDFQGEFLTNYPMLFSAVVLSSIPLLIAYVFLQKHFISGMTSGALK